VKRHRRHGFPLTARGVRALLICAAVLVLAALAGVSSGLQQAERAAETAVAAFCEDHFCGERN
jgi:hypothetical protein